MRRFIGVIGGRKATPELLQEAEAVGRLIAEREAVLICGGLEGVMEAASRGARSRGGLTVGILPQDNRSFANPYVEIPIVTGMGVGRNVIIVKTSDALIAIGGEYGTLSEIAFALQLGKPVIGIKTWKIQGVIDAKDADDAVKKAFQSIGTELA